MSLFDIPDSSMVITSSYVLDDRMPILEVIHEEDEEGELWQFHCGNGDFSSLHLRLVQLETIMRRDPSLLELTEMEIGMRARRTEVGAEWTYEALPPLDEEDL